MAEECKTYTAFTCGPIGFYECDTMPFGATNAPATFQRLMHVCLGELNMNWCIVYLDDIIIFSDTKEEHLKRLEAVFQKLCAAGLKLKPSKCFFFREEIEYLGHVVSGKGISTNPKKIEAVSKWPTPKTVYDVRSFLGFVGYYRRFIKNFSRITKPIREVITGLENQSKRTATKTYIEWTDAADTAFEHLKAMCVSTPILAYPDYQLPFTLHTDSSTDGLGAVLYQKQDGKLRVIAYASRSVSKAESNYPAHKLEFLALKWAVCEKFHLHCEDVSWEQATDKIPHDLVRYLLGDLVPHLSTLVFLRGNRCLFMIDWTKVPDSYAVWQYMLNNSFHKRTSMQVAHYHFTFMLSHVGPKYEDLVDLYCQAYLGEPHPSFRKEDVWVQGSLQPMEHPEMLYLPPTLPGSTPKKANIAKPQSRSDLPSLEEMGQQELVELVKQLLEERANRQTPLSNPNKDVTVAGHTSMNQESLIQNSQAILQGLAEGGYIHAKTPKFESFFGDEKKNKLDFDMWERQVMSEATTHSGAAIKQAMMQSLKGQALMVTSALPPDASWEKLLQALKIKYQDKAPYDVLMAQFYGTKMDIDEKCAFIWH